MITLSSGRGYVHHPWVHTNTTSVCTQNEWTLSTGHKVIRFQNNYIIYYDGQYYLRDIYFGIRDDYFILNNSELELPERTNISTIERLRLSLGYPINNSDIDFTFDFKEHSFRVLMEHITLLALKDLKLINSNFSFRKQTSYGKHIYNMYLKCISGSGRVKSCFDSLRFLNEQDTLQLKPKLFNTSNLRYQVGVYSMKYEPTVLCERLFEHVFELIKAIDFKHKNIDLKSLDFIVDINLLKDIKLRDVMLLMNDCIGYMNGFVIRPQPEDKQKSRVYSVMTSISSETRTKLGFKGYDIGCAMQTICMNLVKDIKKYPLHLEYVNDKHAFRQRIMRETDKDITWVKKIFSAIDNMAKLPKKIDKYQTISEYFKEALRLRKEIVEGAEIELKYNADRFAKNKIIIRWHGIGNKPTFEQSIEKKESSMFFFIWTQWEREIREHMKLAFLHPKACHDVHDAIYSKEIVEPSIIEEKVKELTGFKIKISVG